MRTTLLDGFITALGAVFLVEALCLVLGGSLATCSEWVFLAGLGLMALSIVWGMAGYQSPPGLVGLWRQDVQVYPKTDRRFWMDRFIGPRNVWLIAGLVCVVASIFLAAL